MNVLNPNMGITVRQNLPDNNAESCPLNPIHVGIVTIIRETELQSVLRAFDIDASVPLENVSGREYWFKTIVSHHHNLNVAVTVAKRQRQAEAQSATADMIKWCNPYILILVGIAAGVRDRIDLVDVVIAETVMYYEPAKLMPGVTEPRPEFRQTGSAVQRSLESFLKSDYKRAWHHLFDKLQRQLNDSELPKPRLMLAPSCQFKHVATGEKILANGSLNKMAKSVNSNIRACETEAWGFTTAAVDAGKKWFVIRGISDFGDKKSKSGDIKDKYHHSAANAAASITRIFLDSMFIEDLFRIDNDEGKKWLKDAGETPSDQKLTADPWMLNNEPIQLNNLCNADFWTSVADEANQILRIKFILPSGKFHGSIKQLPLISDAMYLPEITADIINLMNNVSYKVEIKVLFDIDIVEWNGAEYHLRKDLISDSNLILTATGDIYLATRLIYRNKMLINIRPGPAAPESSQILGVSDCYPEVLHQELGLLSVCRSPFNDRRIIILNCGTLAVGTIGAQLLLLMYIRGKTRNLGNNNKDNRISAKIVDFRTKVYKPPLPLLQSSETTPSMQLLNVDIQSMINGSGVQE